MERKHIERLATRLTSGDLAFLTRVVDYCGGFSGAAFKDRLIATLELAQDFERKDRVQLVVKKLDEAGILWLCEHGEDARRH